MIKSIFQLLYIFAVISLLAYLWGLFISGDTQLYFYLFLITSCFVYQFLSAHRLLSVLMKGELLGSKASFGVWRDIYYLLQKINKSWFQKVKNAEEQQAQFIQVIQASPNGILILDQNDQIEWCNEVSGRQLGLDPERDLLQHITHLLRKPVFIQYMHSKNYQESIELSEMGIHGNLLLSVQIFPYGSNKKLMLTQDITQRKQVESMRRDFVANVSHELKTPLTVLGGFLETIHELPLNEEDRKRYIELMIAQSNQMRTLVDDLLILTKLESSPPPSLNGVVDTKLIFDNLKIDANALSNNRHQIAFDYCSGKFIHGDAKEIFSAFGNLISNAVRYTPEGGRIQVNWIDLPEGGCEFSVHDSGPGIDAAHIPRLTERFYRVDSGRSRESGGTGLGLAIVKYIVMRHNGSLVISSELGRGSLFAITFPKKQVYKP